MNNKSLGTLVFLLLAIGLLIGAVLYFGKSLNQTVADTKGNGKIRQLAEKEEEAPKESKSVVQEELENLSAQMIADIQSERRLNLGMVGHLRAYDRMLTQIQSYAEDVEKQIAIIQEIAKDEFQEDVQLQASLFAGKKPDLVAKHLEEFRASRVGAILSKMKEKEASAVLDVWAKQNDPRVSAFYRETMASYLSNKRREMHPELFPGSDLVTEGEKQ